MRPIFLEYPNVESFYGDDRDFLFGPDLFVAPVTTETTDAEGVVLPPGEWYDFRTLEKHTNKDQISLHPKMDEVPLYVRAGAIVPLQPLVQYTAEKPNGPLELRVYLPSSTSANDCRGALYQDDGHTFAYQRGEILRVNYSCQVSANSVIVTSSVVKNTFKPWWRSAEIELYGVASAPKEVRVGAEIDKEWKYDSQTHSVTLAVPGAVRNWSVQIGF
jgi:alpha-glucosidase